MKKDVDMLNGSIIKGLFAIALPIMVMNVVQSLFNIVDMTVLKNFSGDEYAVGAVGACGTLITLITGLLIGCASGVNVSLARYIGSGDESSAARTVGTAVLFALTGGIVIGGVGILFAEQFLGWMSCPEALLPTAVLYFRLYFAGVPILMVYNFCASVLHATGDSGRPMLFLTIGGVLKVLFNILFVAVWKLSVLGVAAATIISWMVSLGLGVRALVKNKNEAVRLQFSKLRFYKRELFSILHIGIPAALQQALYSFANVIIASAVNLFGAAATTGLSIANNFDGLLYQVVVAPALAVMPYVSQNVGAGNIKRAKSAVLRGILITIGFGATLGALSAIFSGELSSIMSSDPEVIRYSQQKMIIISSTYFICGINEIMGASMRGLGKPLIPTVATLMFMCAIRFVWVYFVFPLYKNLTFLYLVWPIGWVLSISFICVFFFPTIRQRMKETKKEVEFV